MSNAVIDCTIVYTVKPKLQRAPGLIPHRLLLLTVFLAKPKKVSCLEDALSVILRPSRLATIVRTAPPTPIPAHVPTNHERFRREKVIIVGVALGWITGLNKSEAVDDAADLVKW